MSPKYQNTPGGIETNAGRPRKDRVVSDQQSPATGKLDQGIGKADSAGQRDVSLAKLGYPKLQHDGPNVTPSRGSHGRSSVAPGQSNSYSNGRLKITSRNKVAPMTPVEDPVTPTPILERSGEGTPGSE